MKKIVQTILKVLAKLILGKYKPKIVGITGSIGKTSTKEAVYAVLSLKFRARRSVKNYNNEIGVPLTILGLDSPGRSLIGWLKLKIKFFSLFMLTDKNFPDVLILEMGIDRPGDMAYLNSIVRPDVGIITMIGPAHLEFFGTIDKIQSEKGLLLENLNDHGWAIVNYDNDKARQLAVDTRSKVLTYGFDDKADVVAKEIIFSFARQAGAAGYGEPAKDSLAGVNFKLGYKGSYVPVLLPQVIGKAAVYSALAGAAVGISFGLNLIDIAQGLKKFKSPQGRMNIIPGAQGTIIIDDSYNASPPAVIIGLEIVKEIPIAESARKIAVLGDMFELGSASLEGHREVGKNVVKSDIDLLITVGVRSMDIARAAEESGFEKNKMFHLADAQTAGKYLRDIIKTGDLVFVKGSQGMRMEKVVKEIMAEPEKAGDLLVRQNAEWLKM